MPEHQSVAEEMEAALYSVATCLSVERPGSMVPMLRPTESSATYRRRLIQYTVDRAKAVAAQSQW